MIVPEAFINQIFVGTDDGLLLARNHGVTPSIEDLNRHFVTIQHHPTFEEWVQIVVIDIEPGEEQLVLFSRERTAKLLLGLGSAQTGPVDQHPETSVVEVVDVAVDLPPRQIVPQYPFVGIEDTTAIKTGWIEQRIFGPEDGGPVKDKGRGELRHDQADDFATTSTVEGSGGSQNEAELI